MPQLSELLHHAAEQRASDLHLKPGYPPFLRRDGHLEATPFPALSTEDTEGLAAAAMPSDRVADLARFGHVRFAYPGPPRCRIHAYWQGQAVALAVRVVPTLPIAFEAHGLPPAVRRLGDESRGLVLVTGPAGSGRTTTAAAIIDHVNETQARHIVTIEDPVEVVHGEKRSVVSQRQLGEDAPDLVSALSAALSQDADVVFAGALARADEVAAALSVAGQGRLVLGIVDATDAAGTVDQVVDLFPPDRQPKVRASLAGCLKGISCQRLLERVDGKGRIAAVEVLLGTGRVADALVNGEGAASLEQIMIEGEYHGMQTFDQSLFTLFKNGLIGLGDALAAASRPHDLRVTLQQAGLDIA